MMNPYLAKTNGKLLLLSLLDMSNITLEDLPTLEKLRNKRTGWSTMCWARVLGPCHYADCYFGSRGGHLETNDYTEQFVEKVIQVIGPTVSARMLALLRSAEEKKVKPEPGASA